MKRVAPYDVVVPVSRLGVFQAAKKRERKQLLDFFDRLAADPSIEGPWTIQDSSGRTNQQMHVGNFLVTFWPDHAAREVRVTRIERTD